MVCKATHTPQPACISQFLETQKGISSQRKWRDQSLSWELGAWVSVLTGPSLTYSGAQNNKAPLPCSNQTQSGHSQASVPSVFSWTLQQYQPVRFSFKAALKDRSHPTPYHTQSICRCCGVHSGRGCRDDVVFSELNTSSMHRERRSTFQTPLGNLGQILHSHLFSHSLKGKTSIQIAPSGHRDTQ